MILAPMDLQPRTSPLTSPIRAPDPARISILRTTFPVCKHIVSMELLEGPAARGEDVGSCQLRVAAAGAAGTSLGDKRTMYGRFPNVSALLRPQVPTKERGRYSSQAEHAGWGAPSAPHGGS